ncbi:MAG: luciferase family protein [Terracidiphilus sp.]|jgi:hypothetical protein
MRDWVKNLVEQVSGWPGVTCHDHRFGGVEFRVGTREIGHAHNFGIVDIPFTVKIRDALIGVGKARRHHWLPDSGWTTVRVKEQEFETACILLRLSYLRFQTKSSEPVTARQAQCELESLKIEPEVLAAAGIAVPAVEA